MGREPGPGAPPPLLVACALGIEQLALRSGDRTGASGPVTVLRTGMGPDRARRAVSRALGAPGWQDAAVIASGFCAGLAPGMHPGDLIVADEARGPDGTIACTGTELLVKALVRAVPGRSVHTGPLIGSDHVVGGPERGALGAPRTLPPSHEYTTTTSTTQRQT
ncbi:1-hydroxy-2-methyl-2-butenyl 4-diphosphate reductase, partial [Streptomyces sp. NPDC056202]|uniref:phosphorylase family protein n=1 Tax=Streptomyces sp. NPDC056202 TaxID=3345745 RepID=UPI0035D98F67